MEHSEINPNNIQPEPIYCLDPYKIPNPTLFVKKKVVLLRRYILKTQDILNQIAQGVSIPELTRKAVVISYPLTGFEVNWIFDDACLLRHLRARSFDIKKAANLIMETIEFRRKNKPERIKPKDVKELGSKGQIFRRGYDKDGFPIIMIRPRYNDKDDDPITGLKLILYTLERAAQSMDRKSGVNRYSFVVDYNGYTISNQPPTDLALNFLDIFQNFYAETLEMAFIIDVPWYFQTFWSCIVQFIPSKTAKKIFFINSENPEDVNKILDKIPSKYIDKSFKFGNCKQEFDADKYWKEEYRQFESYMKFLQQEFVTKAKERRESTKISETNKIQEIEEQQDIEANSADEDTDVKADSDCESTAIEAEAEQKRRDLRTMLAEKYHDSKLLVNTML